MTTLIEEFNNYKNENANLSMLEINTRLDKQRATEGYKTLRASSYPPIGDQLDALFHAGVFPQKMADKIQAVKDAYPKPTGEI